MKRDLLKAVEARVICPEIGLEMNPGTLGGIYTTVEGLFSQVKRQLEQSSMFSMGDSGDRGDHMKIQRTCTTRISELGKQSQWRQALRCLEVMQDQVVAPNAINFNALISVCGRGE